MKRFMTVILTVLMAVAFLPMGSKEAQALSCSASISTPINFGNIDVLSGGAIATTGVLNVTCDVTVLDLVPFLAGIAICPGIGAGTGGANSSSRLLVRDGGTETLSYQIYSDANGQVPWGSYGGGLLFGDAPLFSLSAALAGSVSGSWPIYLTIAGGQSTVPPGVYRSTFSGLGGTGTEIRYGSLAQLLGCSGLGALYRTSANFTIQATVPKNCLVSTEEVNFGTHGILNSPIPAEGAIDIKCTQGTGYSVSLETGGLPSSQRQMKNGSAAVTYALFQNSQRTQLWGNAPGEIATGTGTGSWSSFPVYGLVPPQTTPPAGVYKDTVIVTVTY